MKRFFKENWLVIVTGVFVGIAALLLQALGNPKNMGFCIACFERDIAGALGLHGAAVVQYVRPEIIGIVLGSCIMDRCILRDDIALLRLRLHVMLFVNETGDTLGNDNCKC